MTERYSIVLQATPGDVPATIRLRRFLKTALRSYGLRCVSVVEATTGDRVASDLQEPPAEGALPSWPRPEGWEVPPCANAASNSAVDETIHPARD